MFPKPATSEETSGNLFALLLNSVEAPLLDSLGFIFYLLSSGTKKRGKIKRACRESQKNKNFSFPPSPKQRLFGDPFPGLSASSPPSACLPLSRAARGSRCPRSPRTSPERRDGATPPSPSPPPQPPATSRQRVMEGGRSRRNCFPCRCCPGI